MKFQISNFKFQTRQGYTLIELMVVLAIMGFIAAIAFYGLRNYNNSQQVINAQKDFVNNLRATQNKVTNGADGVNYKNVIINSPDQYNYVADGVTIKLPNQVYFLNSTITICFANPNLSSISCDTCGNNFSCPVAGGSPQTITVTFSNGSTTKSVSIQGSGMFINRIYAN